MHAFLVSNRRAAAALLLAFALLGVGCGSAAPKATHAATSRSLRRMLRADRGEQGVAALCPLTTVYFDYDSYLLDTNARDELEQVATCLRHGTNQPIHLTGRADPRGTEEYNLALGERRALSVKRYLIGLGVDENEVTFASTGEEMANGHDNDSWALDRNVGADNQEAGSLLDAPTALLH